MWKQLEPTAAHLTYLVLSGFLIIFALFSVLIRNRLHLSEPPLALITGVIFGSKGIGALDPSEYGASDNFIQEFTRIIVGLQVFAVGLELPRHYLRRHYGSLLLLLGPVMLFGWLACALFIWAILGTTPITALTISACLTPTDPVLAASVLSNSQFSQRVPGRIRRVLSAESGCNDGVSFPFLYVGLAALTSSSSLGAFKDWVLLTVLWQCALGSLVGGLIGFTANRALRFSDSRKMIGPSSFLAFYLLLALLAIGVGSTLGLDDFLVAFFAGAAFSHDGWFSRRSRESKLNNILDLMLNSTFFVYLGATIPWSSFSPRDITPTVTPGRLLLLLVAVLLLRRIPIVLALKPYIPALRTWQEAFFMGHFGPMGVGALFLAIEARAKLETDTSHPLPEPRPDSPHLGTVELVWPVVTFVVMGSTLVHGLSVAVVSIFVHFTRQHDQRAHLPGAETDPLGGMVHEDEDGEETQSDEGGEDDEDGDDGWSERRNRLVLPVGG